MDRKRREGKRVSPNTIPKDFITFSSSIVNLGVTQGHQHVAKSHRRSALDSRPWTRKLDYEYKDVGTFDRPIHEHHRANSLSMNVGWDWSQVAGESIHRQPIHTRGQTSMRNCSWLAVSAVPVVTHGEQLGYYFSLFIASYRD